MTNALIPAAAQQLVGKYETEEAWKEVATGAVFLPYIQLMGSSSDLVKEGKFPMGHFALVRSKEDIVDMGDHIICVLLKWRPKAMQYQGEVFSVYDRNSEAYKQIKERADTVKQNPGCGYGPEFLIWLPDFETFALYFLGNPTGRTEASNFQKYLGKVCKVNAFLIKNKKKNFAWHGPRVVEHDYDVSMPPEDEIIDQITKFINPREKEREPAEAGRDR